MKTPTDPAPILDPDRYFDPDPRVRALARALYEGTRDLPIIAPHGHVEARILADDSPFPEPTELLVVPDHYIVRMLYSQGVPMAALGVRPRDRPGDIPDPRAAWRIFAGHLHLFRGTPTAAWLSYELHEVFGVRERLGSESADRIYDEITEKLRSPEFRPRALFEHFGIEVLTTTDAATDTLEHHRSIAESGWGGRVVPCFRPDAVFRIAGPGWTRNLAELEEVHGRPIRNYSSLLEALSDRRRFFAAMGATSTDHGVLEPFTAAWSNAEMERLFRKGIQGEATEADQRDFEAGMLMEMARMSTEDGLVMQIHPGALRDHNRMVLDRFGTDMGGDIPVQTEYTRNLRPLLNEYGNDPRLTLVLFTLDESTYSRELAPLAGHYPAVRLGPPWWFHDSIEGMTRFRQRTTETSGIYNTVGFNDDTRAFCSIPARHDLSRRVDANYLAGLVARHVVDLSDAREMARELAYDLVRAAYNLDRRESTRG